MKKQSSKGRFFRNREGREELDAFARLRALYGWSIAR
jgi:hypothetical protein